MKLSYLFVLFILIAGCSEFQSETVTVNVQTAQQQIATLQGVKGVSIYRRVYRGDKWTVSLEIKTACGDMEVRKEGSNLQAVIEDAVVAAKCVQMCK